MLDRRSFLVAIAAAAPASVLTSIEAPPGLAAAASAGSPRSRGPRRAAPSSKVELPDALRPRTNGSPRSRGPRRPGSAT
jgi:hypothetical protein